jgi:cytochrome c-type biogenesis protein CcmH
MVFWIAAAIMTVFVLALILWPLMRAGEAEAPENVEVALYRSQLLAIAEEEGAGRIAAAEAEATRNEVKRRMLASSRRAPEERNLPREARPRRLLVIGLAVPLVALAVYLTGGRPGLPDQPFADRARERAAAGVPSTEERALVRELATRMAQHPEDPQGWALLGGAYVRQGRYDEAVEAYQNANARKPSDPDILSALGEALVLQADGVVTENARADFEAAVKLAPDNIRARYFVALAKAQSGDFAGAAAGWRALLASAPKDAPWRASVEAELKQAQQAQGDAAATP